MIVPMKRASVVCLKEDRENLLKAFQKSAYIMLIPPDEAVSGGSEESEAGISNDYKRTAEILKQIKSFEQKKGMLSQRPEATYDDLLCVDDNSLELQNKFSENLLRINNVKTVIADNKASLKRLLPWVKLSSPVETLNSSKYTKVVTGFVGNKKAAGFKSALETVGAQVELFSSGSEGTSCVVACYVDDFGAVSGILKEFDFSEHTINLESGLVSEEYKRLVKRAAYLDGQLETENNKLEELSKKSDALRLLFEQIKAENNREEAPCIETDRTVFFEGWVRSDEVDELKKVADKSTMVCDIEFSDPKKGETPPTATKNSKFVQQFEVITDMFSIPSYNAADPNPVMAPWYWIIFGLMVGDAGYGLLMLILGFLFVKLYKPRGTTRKIANIILLSSFTTMFWGVMMGSYFGATWNPIMFSPLEDPVAMLIFSLGLGILHIFSGMLIKAYESIKSGHVWDAVFDQFSWIFVITGLCMLFLEQTRTIGMFLAIAGGATILIAGGRKKDTVMGKVTGGFADLYGVTGYLSDILSYSRILALGLATGVVAMVMNMLASMMSVSVIGVILSLFVYLIGHAFNLVLGLLSAYVHDSRLQYIEFFNKFYDGGGEVFDPLAVNTNYVDIKK